MIMIDRFKRAFAALRNTPRPVAKTEITAPLTYDQFFNRYEAPEWGDSCGVVPTSRAMEAAYQTHPIVRACIDLIAGTAPVAQLEVGKYTDGTWDAVTGHPALDLINIPNPYQGRLEFLTDFTTRAYSGGVGYIWKIRNKSGSKVVELRALPASWVSPQRPTYGLNLVDYYQVAGQDRIVMPEDMVEMRFASPHDLVSSIGPLAGAWMEIWSDSERAKMFGEIVHNMEIPSTVLVTDTGRTTQDKDRLLREMSNRIGRGKRGAPISIKPDERLETMGTIPDLDWPGLMTAAETRICSVLGVPPLLIQSRAGLERSTYSNAEQMSKNFYQITMRRYWEQLAAVLTRGLLRDSRIGRGDDQLEFRFAFESLEQFAEDANAEAARLLSLYQGGVLTLGEVRAEIGFPPIKEVIEQALADEDAMAAVKPKPAIPETAPQAQPPEQKPPEQPEEEDAEEEEDTPIA